MSPLKRASNSWDGIFRADCHLPQATLSRPTLIHLLSPRHYFSVAPGNGGELGRAEHLPAVPGEVGWVGAEGGFGREG